MSDNLIIREDGIGRLIRGVDALEIKLQSGGTSRWVRFNPRDQKSVNANGEYHAKDDNVDGYRTITVNVPTRTKSQEPGRDQEIFNPDTGTGYYTDDDGFLHEEVVPDEIRIMHVPDKTTYQDGEQIDLEGIVVQAYRDGEVWTSEQYPDGYIPVHELTYSPTNAKESGEKPTIEVDGIRFYKSLYRAGTAQKLNFDDYTGPVVDKLDAKYFLFIKHNYSRKVNNSTLIYSQYDVHVFGKEDDEDVGKYERQYPPASKTSTSRIITNNYFFVPEHSGTKIYYKNYYSDRRSKTVVTYEGKDDFEYNPEVKPFEYEKRALYLAAYRLLYDEVPEEESKWTSEETVIVSWQRPKDGKTLSASFNIYVEAAS